MHRPRTALFLLATIVLAACGSPSVEPSAGAPGGGCRPPLGEDDPHPIGGGAGGNHPAFGDLAWLEPVQTALQTTHADVTAGLWLDQRTGEVVVMLVGDDQGVALAELRELVDDAGGDPTVLVCMEAAYTEAELLDIQHRLTTLSTGPSTSGIDTVRNRVEVLVETDGELVRERIEASFDDRERAAIRMDVPDCAEIVPLPDGATALPGGGSTCSGMDALFEGTLVVEDGCAWFETDQETTAVAWPRGWYVDEAGTVHDHHGRARASGGDPVSSGGGFVPVQDDAACGPVEDGAWLVSSLEVRG